MNETRKHLKEEVLAIQKADNARFEELALDMFKLQAAHCNVYRQYLEFIRCKPEQVRTIESIPFLPITLFKTQYVASNAQKPLFFFESSGTTGQITSKQPVFDPKFYQAISTKIFTETYGSLKKYKILALLPSYLERNNSSLVFMVDHFFKQSAQGSGFYLNDAKNLWEEIRSHVEQGNNTILLGVTYALLQMADASPSQLPKHVIVMETGGMKGRYREMLREEVHHKLSDAFGADTIHSEYGMTELFSQAYSKGYGIFEAPSTMRILLREPTDPFSTSTTLTKGAINVIDLANIDTCSFIETNDLGEIASTGFKVTGRMDNSDIRGCNLMVSG